MIRVWIRPRMERKLRRAWSSFRWHKQCAPELLGWVTSSALWESGEMAIDTVGWSGKMSMSGQREERVKGVFGSADLQLY